MSEDVLVAGVAMTQFRKPSELASYVMLGVEAAEAALADAGIDYHHVGEAYCASMYADSGAGQRVLYDVGLTGIPIINVNNQCAGGSTALALAARAIRRTEADCVLAVGFEQITPAAGPLIYDDRPGPVDRHIAMMEWATPASGGPLAARLFASAALHYRQAYGLAPDTLAAISVKSRRHAYANGKALFRDPVSIDEVLRSPMIAEPLTKFQCCPSASGAAAAVICSGSFAKRHGLSHRAIRIAGQALVTDTVGSFTDPIGLVGAAMTADAMSKACSMAGLGISDIDVIELHDCFTINELITYEGLGMVARGEACKLVRDSDTTYGGKWVVNPSGGLLSKGHPISATGLGQCAELVTQLRGEAAARQVEGARVALQHNLGLGGACVVTIYLC